jgi:hypothetical protein
VGLATGCREPYADDLVALEAAAGIDARYGPWLSRDGTAAIVQGLKDGDEVLWYGRRTGDQWATVITLPHEGMVAGVSLSADGRFAAASTVVAGGAIRPVRVDLQSGRTVLLEGDIDADRNAICLSSDGTRVAFMDRSMTIAIWEARPDGTFSRAFACEATSYDRPVGFLDDGRLAIQHGWDFKQPSTVAFVTADGAEETAYSLPLGRAPLALSPDGSTLVFRDGSLWAGSWSYGTLRRDGSERQLDVPSGYHATACWIVLFPTASPSSAAR